MTSIALGNLIAEGRRVSGKSRPTIAFELSSGSPLRFDQSWIARVENGSIERPDRERLILLAQYLGVSVSEALRLADYNAGTERQEHMAPAIFGMLSAWEAWELNLLQGELPMLRARYRAIRAALQETPALRVAENQGHYKTGAKDQK